MDYLEIVKNRIATRSFKNDKVSDEDLNYILECGRLAPTAKNNQPEHIIVCKSDEALERVDKITVCRYNAQSCLIVCADKNIAWSNENYNSFELDAGIVATHMVLAAEARGINSCIVGMFDIKEVQNEFNLSENVIPVILIMLGYKTDDYLTSRNHNDRKSLEEIIEVI